MQVMSAWRVRIAGLNHGCPVRVGKVRDSCRSAATRSPWLHGLYFLSIPTLDGDLGRLYKLPCNHFFHEPCVRGFIITRLVRCVGATWPRSMRSKNTLVEHIIVVDINPFGLELNKIVEPNYLFSVSLRSICRCIRWLHRQGLHLPFTTLLILHW